MHSERSYLEWRAEILAKFAEKSLVEDSVCIHLSPSGRYRLETSRYSSEPAGWDYSRGVVTDTAKGRLIADIKRNHAGFWFAWVLQEDDQEFLLCGEDYQGYNVIDLRRATNTLTFSQEAFDGRGFCWYAARPSADGKTLAVEGCYWACPSELIVFDFSDPSLSPLPELHRVEDLGVAEGWISTNEFRYTIDEQADGTTPPPQIWTRPAAAGA